VAGKLPPATISAPPTVSPPRDGLPVETGLRSPASSGRAAVAVAAMSLVTLGTPPPFGSAQGISPLSTPFFDRAPPEQQVSGVQNALGGPQRYERRHLCT